MSSLFEVIRRSAPMFTQEQLVCAYATELVAQRRRRAAHPIGSAQWRAIDTEIRKAERTLHGIQPAQGSLL